MSADDVFNQALIQGLANQETIRLAHHHCRQMRFVEDGGQGMAEAASGLPINMRRIECSLFQGGSSGNLDWIASLFYEDHCVGCLHRQPTGQVPNLATLMEARRTEQTAAEVEKARKTVSQHQQWADRFEARRRLFIGADPSMVQAMTDMGTLDQEPGVDHAGHVAADQEAALRRLNALANEAPQFFTDEVVNLALQLVENVRVMGLLVPLRRLASHGTSIARSVVDAALSGLHREPSIEAARCVDELRAHVHLEDFDDDVVHSLVVVAGGMHTDAYGRRRGSAGAEPGGLRVAADLAPDVVERVLKEMLPSAGSVSSGILLPGQELGATFHSSRSNLTSEGSRFSAAEAIKSLLNSHPHVSVKLVDSLVLNLNVAGDRHHRQSISSVINALAAMLVLAMGDVSAALQRAAGSGSNQFRGELFHVYGQAARLIDPNDRWRQPEEDSTAAPDAIDGVYESLVTACLTRIGGDWGHDVGYSAAHLLVDLAQRAPESTLSRVDTLLGAFLNTINRIDEPQTSPLEITTLTPETSYLTGLDDYSRRHSLSATAREILTAVESASKAGPVTVCRSVKTLIADERDSERGIAVTRRLVPLLGKIGRAHGDEPRVLQEILPSLHSALLGTDTILRSVAIDAWVDIASQWPVPSSFLDLLQPLLEDMHVVVIESMLRAAQRLPWSDEDRAQFLNYATGVCQSVSVADHKDLLKSAMRTIRNLTIDDELAVAAQRLAISRAGELDGYDLRDALRGTWQPEVARSAVMASIRLVQARDQRINDRFNPSDDEELCALLDCGAGLNSLSAETLTVAALDLTPEMPLAAAEFAEVIWRAGSPEAAKDIMRKVENQTPDEPAYNHKKMLARLIGDAAAFDAAPPTDLSSATNDLTRSLEALTNNFPDGLERQIRARVEIKCLFANSEPPVGSSSRATRPEILVRTADMSRERAARIVDAGAELAAMSKRQTATAFYVRAVASLCDIAAHLLRLDAAELDADSSALQAHATACQRMASELVGPVIARFGDDDPLAGPLIQLLRDVGDVATGSQATALVSRCSTLPLPLLIVDGPRVWTSRSSVRDAAQTVLTIEPVAVVLASLDGELITGPAVVRPNRIYQLGLKIHPPEWPDWADHLEAELIGHMSSADIETPIFSWSRPQEEDNEATLSEKGPLILRFELGAGQPAPPLLVSLRWRGTDEDGPVTQRIDVAGHHELRLRPFDSSRDFLTHDPPFDERLLTLYEQIRSGGYDEDHIQAFCRLFTSVSRAALEITWDKKYKEGVSVTEKQFHDDLFSRLQQETELGGRLERGNSLALGFLDVRHDKITAELKVERRSPVTKERAPKYMGQPTQYASADGARISILCVLDLSKKRSPVGAPENYVFTLQPALHGLTNPEAPSLVAVIVINGNNPRPSSFSRRKVPTQEQEGESSKRHKFPD